ncbi:MAG: MFS transporter [Candidatus Limnocylindrales bacterium]
MRLFAAFRCRSFAVLWTAQTLSRLGDRIYLIGLAWYVVATTGSASAMAAVLVANLVPTLGLLLVGGVAVDRWSRARLMLASDLARALLVGAAAGLATAGLLGLPLLLALSAGFGVVDAFFDPAYTAIVPQLVELELRPSANSLTELSRRLARVAGPAIGAALVAVTGVAMAFALDSVSFVASALGMLVIARGTSTTPQREPSESPVQDVRDGLSAVFAVPWLWITILVAAITNITLAGPLEAVMPLLVTKHFGAGVELLGGLDALAGIGSVGAAIWLGGQTRLRHRGLLVYLPWVGCGLAVAALGLPLPIAAAGLLMVVVGASLTTLELVWMHTLQELVPEGLLGRVSSIDLLGSAALVPIGYVAAGALADTVGPAAVFGGGGAATAAILALALLHPAIRRLD